MGIDEIGTKTGGIDEKTVGIAGRTVEIVEKTDGTAGTIATRRATATGIRHHITDATIAATVRDGWAETIAFTGARTTVTTADATMARLA